MILGQWTMTTKAHSLGADIWTKKILQSFKAARRGTNSDNGKVLVVFTVIDTFHFRGHDFPAGFFAMDLTTKCICIFYIS